MNSDMVVRVLKRFGLGPPTEISQAGGGKVHDTVYVNTKDGTFVLQRLKEPFNHLTALDAHAVTSHLLRHGFPVPRFLLTREGEPFLRDDTGVYRIMNRIQGRVLTGSMSPDTAYAAGRMSGLFHALMLDLEYTPRFHVEGFHDPVFYLHKLDEAVGTYAVKAAQMSRLIERFRTETRRFLLPATLPRRWTHGDLKGTNFLWDQDGEPCALLDFDTVGLGTYPVDMADAFRSWCSDKTDPDKPLFRLDLLSPAWNGYQETAPTWTFEERQGLLSAIPLIFLELGTRYLIDALEEAFFAWDPSTFATRSEHNLSRAQTRWRLYQDVLTKLPDMEEIIMHSS